MPEEAVETQAAVNFALMGERLERALTTMDNMGSTLESIKENMASKEQVKAVETQVKAVDDRLRTVETQGQRLEAVTSQMPSMQAEINALKQTAVRSEDLTRAGNHLQEEIARLGATLRETIHTVESDAKTAIKEVKADIAPLQNTNTRASAYIALLQYVGIGGLTSIVGVIIWWFISHQK